MECFRPFCLTPHALLLTFLFVLPTFPQQKWEKTYGGPMNDDCYSIQQTNDGGYIAVGETYSFGAGINEPYWGGCRKALKYHIMQYKIRS
jgi:hypothetical protein